MPLEGRLILLKVYIGGAIAPTLTDAIGDGFAFNRSCNNPVVGCPTKVTVTLDGIKSSEGSLGVPLLLQLPVGVTTTAVMLQGTAVPKLQLSIAGSLAITVPGLLHEAAVPSSVGKLGGIPVAGLFGLVYPYMLEGPPL